MGASATGIDARLEPQDICSAACPRDALPCQSCPLLEFLLHVKDEGYPSKKPLSRRDRSPYPRLTPPSLHTTIPVSKLLTPSHLPTTNVFNLPSSLASSLGASAAASPPAAAAPPAAVGAAAAPPPEPTFMSRSLTSLPSRALAKSWHQMGSTSGTLAAVMRDWSLSACNSGGEVVSRIAVWAGYGLWEMAAVQ